MRERGGGEGQRRGGLTHPEQLRVHAVDRRLDQRRDERRDRVEELAVVLGEAQEVASEGDAVLEVVPNEVAVVVLELEWLRVAVSARAEDTD